MYWDRKPFADSVTFLIAESLYGLAAFIVKVSFTPLTNSNASSVCSSNAFSSAAVVSDVVVPPIPPPLDEVDDDPTGPLAEDTVTDFESLPVISSDELAVAVTVCVPVVAEALIETL